MSWYTDPQLFISYYGSSRQYYIDKIVKKYNVPLSNTDFTDSCYLDFSKHLSLGTNKESDYDDLKSSLAINAHANFIKLVNCEGLVVLYNRGRNSGTWSRVEEDDSIFYSLPGIKNPCDTVLSLWAERKAVEKKNSINKEKMTRKMIQLVAENSLLKEKLDNEVTNLQKQLNQEKSEREAQVLDLKTKLRNCCCAGRGSADVEPWMSGRTVPSNWVPFEELGVLNMPENNPVTIMEGSSNPTFVEDVTTNVQVNRFCFYGTLIVAVNVEGLSPDNEKARFDPDIWGVYKNSGVSYAARKPLDSEINKLWVSRRIID